MIFIIPRRRIKTNEKFTNDIFGNTKIQLGFENQESKFVQFVNPIRAEGGLRGLFAPKNGHCVNMRSNFWT